VNSVNVFENWLRRNDQVANITLSVAAMMLIIAAAWPTAAAASRRRATRLTSNPPAVATANVALVISGRLTSAASDTGVHGQPVGLYWEASGAKHFEHLSAAKTGSNGRYSLR
jgi:hypothetical protein